jgi:LacI family transcriptional regulator
MFTTPSTSEITRTERLRSITLTSDRRRPLFEQVKEQLTRLVVEEFDDGELFYTERALVERLPVSQITVRRALREMAAEGLLQPVQGRGTLVRKRPNASATRSSAASLRAQGAKRPTALRTVGIFRPENQLYHSEYGLAMMHEFQMQCAAAGLGVRFYDTSGPDQLAAAFASLERNADEEAFVLHTPSDTTLLLYHALAHRGYRTVAMEGVGPNYPGPVVATDAEEAVGIGMRHLTELGHTRIALLVNEPIREFNVAQKVDAFQAFVARTGLPATCRIVVCDSVARESFDAALAQMPALFAGGESARPTAIFTVSDPGAWAAIKWCQQQGMRVPGDISVLGFEDAKSSKYMHPSVSSVGHPIKELASRVLDTLWRGAPENRSRILVPPILFARESTGPAPLAG